MHQSGLVIVALVAAHLSIAAGCSHPPVPFRVTVEVSPEAAAAAAAEGVVEARIQTLLASDNPNYSIMMLNIGPVPLSRDDVTTIEIDEALDPCQIGGDARLLVWLTAGAPSIDTEPSRAVPLVLADDELDAATAVPNASRCAFDGISRIVSIDHSAESGFIHQVTQ
jgi:hypothetical protein